MDIKQSKWELFFHLLKHRFILYKYHIFALHMW